MPRVATQMPDWIAAEESSLVLLRGEERLTRMWSIVERLAAADEIDASIIWLKKIFRAAWKESRFDYTLRAFTELRRIYTDDPRFGHLRKNVLWYYKWLAEELPEYCDVPLATLHTIHDEMEAFYRQHNVCLRPVFSLRCRAAILMGQSDEALAWFEKWQAEPKGESDDCAACELDRKLAYLFDRDRFEEGLAEADPILRGKVFCEDTSETLTRLAAIAVRLKRVNLARAILKVTRKDVRRIKSMLSSLAGQVVFHFLLDNKIRARRLAIVALRRARAATNDLNRYNVYRSCGMWAAFSVLASVMDETLLQQTVPQRVLPGADPASSEKIPVTEIAGTCLAEAARLAARFDARNQTSRFTNQLAELDTAIRKVASSEHLQRRT